MFENKISNYILLYKHIINKYKFFSFSHTHRIMYTLQISYSENILVTLPYVFFNGMEVTAFHSTNGTGDIIRLRMSFQMKV